MAKLTLSNVSNLSGAEATAISTINTNSDNIETALENTLSRDGTSPNQMNADLDMNHNDILNAETIETVNLSVDGEIIDLGAIADNAAAAAASAQAASAFDGNGLWVNDVSSLLANVSFTYTAGELGSITAGDYIRTRADHYCYQVADSAAVDNHAVTAGGVKLYVMPNPDGYYANAFGAIGDDATDNTAEIQKALDVATENVLRFKPGVYQTLALTPPSNTTIKCEKGTVFLKMAGSGNGNLIAHTDKTGLYIRGVTFLGNSGGTTTGTGAAIRVYLSSGATGHGEGYDIQDCHFENFKAAAWVQFINDSTSYQIKNPKVSNNSWKSLTGNVLDGTSLAVQSSCVSFSGLLNAACYVEDIECNNNVADGTYIKRFVEFWNGCRKFNCTENRLKNFGTDASVGIDSGNYAIMLYDSSLQVGMRSGVIANNVIDGFKSVGIYCAGASDTIFVGNTILNGSATSEVSMPRGGIVLGAGWDIICSSNYIESMGTNGIRVLGVGSWTGSGAGHADIINNISVVENTVKSCATAIKVDGSGYAIGTVVGGLTLADNRVSGFYIKGNSLSENTTGVKVQTYGPNIEDLSITDNFITSVVTGSRGVEFVVYAGGALGPAGFNNLDTLIQGNKINVAQYAMLLPTALGSLIVRENTLSGDFSARGIQATSCENLALISNTFQNVTSSSQACYYTNASKGVHSNTMFLACDTNKISVGATDMGRAVPTWTPVGRGAFVESIMLIEAGVALSKYVNRGWYYDGTAWREQRQLTGN